MTTASPDDLERRIKELERETREEELRQLKANAKVNWVTPTALAALLPLLAGLALWVVSEVKQYGAGYQALRDNEVLERDKKALQEQKASLNLELLTLSPLKELYAEQARRLKQEAEALKQEVEATQEQARRLRQEVQETQEIMDRTYLRAMFLGSETNYALGHVTGAQFGLDRKTLDAIKVDIRSLPKESAARLEDLLSRYSLIDDMIKMSLGLTSSFQTAMNLLPASAWAKRLQYMPSGSILSGRNIILENGPDGQRYYDITEGRFLTKDEAKGAAR